MNTAFRLVSLAALAASALSASAQATVYDSLGYAPGNALVSVPLGSTPASLFVPTASGLLTGFQVWTLNFESVPVSVNVRLFADAASDTVGSQLGSFPAILTPGNQTVTIPAAGVALAAGTKYWLEMDGGTNDPRGFSNQAWYQAGPGAPTTKVRIGGAYYTGNAPFAFSVQAAPVPEPSALAALGVGALGLLRRRLAEGVA